MPLPLPMEDKRKFKMDGSRLRNNRSNLQIFRFFLGIPWTLDRLAVPLDELLATCLVLTKHRKAVFYPLFPWEQLIFI